MEERIEICNFCGEPMFEDDHLCRAEIVSLELRVRCLESTIKALVVKNKMAMEIIENRLKPGDN